VAATPSHSGSSQGEASSDDAEPYYGRQPEPTYDDIPDNTDTQQLTQLFDDSSELSSSYERLLAGESPSRDPTCELQATQVNDSEADPGIQIALVLSNV